jgi:hypothetical protein
MVSSQLKHHVAFRAWLSFGFVGAPLGLGLFACTQAIPTLEVAVIATLAAFASTGLIGLFARIIPLLTTDDRGVGGFDFWFRQQHITWKDVTRVAEFKIPGFPCLRIFSATSRWPIWAPIALAHPDQFVSAVAAHTEIWHPLRRYLEGGAA